MRISIFLATSLIGCTIALPAAAITSFAEITRGVTACTDDQSTPDKRIAACSKVLASPLAQGELRAQVLVARAITRIENGDSTGGLKDIDESIRVHPNAAAYSYRGMLLMSAKEFNRAIADLTRAIDLSTEKDANNYRIRAHARSQIKDYIGAAADMTSAIEIDVKPERDYALRGMAYEDAGDKKNAVADYERALAVDPDNQLLRDSIHQLGGTIPAAAQLPPGDCGAAGVSNEKRAAACADLIASGKVTGWTLRTAYCNRGTVLTDMGQYNVAFAEADKLLGFDKKAACGYLNRGRALYYKNEVDKAIADYNETIKLDPTFHEAFANRGTAYHSREDYARAIADYDSAIKIERKVPMYYSDRGNSRLLMGDAHRAIVDFNRAIELEGDNAKTFIRRAHAFLKIRDFGRAEADFNRVLELSPGNHYARQGLAVIKELRAGSTPNAEARTQTARPNETGFERFQRVLRSE